MKKYKLVGVISFIVGLFQILFSLVIIFFVIPKTLQLHGSLSSTDTSIVPAVLLNVFVLLVGVVNIVLAWKLLSNKTEYKEKYLKFAIVMLLLSFGMIFIATLNSVLSTVNSVYSL